MKWFMWLFFGGAFFIAAYNIYVIIYCMRVRYGQWQDRRIRRAARKEKGGLIWYLNLK